MRKLLFKLIRFSGLPFLFREIIYKDKVRILLFHDISVEIAEQTFVYLIKKYNILDLNDYIKACENKDKTKIKKKSLIITFDDGHIGNYKMLPIIKKYNIPITIFLCTAIIDSNRHFWFKFKQNSICTSDLKHMSNKERINILSKNGFEQEKDFHEPQALSRKQINEMKNYINIQSHTMFHPCLPKCDDNEARKEIFYSREMLKKKFDLNINAIAYPNGDYSERDIKLSKEANYKCGITVDFGFNTIKTDLFRLKRLSVNDTSDLNELIVKSSGVWAFFKTRNGKKQEFG